MKRILMIVVAMACCCFDSQAQGWQVAKKRAMMGKSVWWSGLNLSHVWTMDEGDGTNIIDRVGTANGILFGVPNWQTQNGIPAIYFDGTNNYVTAGDICDLGDGGVAFGVWSKRVKNTASAGLIGKSRTTDGSGQYALSFDGNGDQQRAYCYTNNALPNILTDAVSSTNSWYFFGCVIDRTNMRISLYRGSILVASGPCLLSGTYNTILPFLIGTMSVNGYTTRIQGYNRDAWLKIDGTTNDLVNVYEATRIRYGQ